MKNNRGKIFFIIFFLCMLFIMIFLNIVIGPLIISFIAAYLLNPLFEFLESKGINRGISSFLTIIILGIITFFAVWIIFPIIFNQIIALIKKLPTFKQYLEEVFFPTIQNFIGTLTGQKNYKVLHFYEVFPFQVEKISQAIISKLGESTRFIASLLIVVIFTPLFSYFLMRDFSKIHKIVFDLVPIDIKPVFIEFIEQINKKLRAVIRGQILVITILCILYSSVFLIAGLPAAIAVGFLTGLARFIPYLDILVGTFLCFFVLVTNAADSSLIMSVSLGFLAIQCLDGLFITPRIIGKYSGLHPVLVILSVLCFGNWFGFYGVLLAIPLTVVGKVSSKMMIKSYKESSFFKNKNSR